MNFNYKIEDTPRDGNCFYHAFIGAFRLTVSPHAIRNFIAARITDEDALLFSGIHGKRIQRSDVRSTIRDTCTWADDVEISALLRNIPNYAIIIINGNQNSLSRRGRQVAMHKAVLYLKDEHYKIVRGATKYLFSVMGEKEFMLFDGNVQPCDLQPLRCMLAAFCLVIATLIVGQNIV